ncbi:isoflavone reductase family protein [Hypoxylon rubiginosum]|uniref:Isoflavone reductase family protein n=1 Tax=Hypoxylon rubiginosum TaxID=110542 RepID=A0ACB9Z4G7_9PEZI|nr:isoflavone reductase family protein [Hypoxylon rubiginosum]
MALTIKVGIVGATGKTGRSVVNGLLASETDFSITALARPSSIDSAANAELKGRGIHVVAADLTGPKEDLVKVLAGIDVVISCIVFSSLEDQIPLAEAAKQAGVGRFVPCDFSTPTTRGVMDLYDQKNDVLAAVQRLHLPYTVIDVGWWNENTVPAVPSGRTDHAVNKLMDVIPGDGTVPVAYTSVSDVGVYVAKIVADPRTLNKKVFAYTEVLTGNQVAELMDEVSGEKSKRNYLPAEDIRNNVVSARSVLEKNPTDPSAKLTLFLNQYMDSWGLRGENTPEYASYLGYLDAKELYPGIKGKTMRTFFQEILSGK